MAITDKTRKLLWANSGNTCALCGRPLSHPATNLDPAVVVGDECHIVSRSPEGPRHDPHFSDDYDGYDNLLLLCTADNRRVDTQVGAYSVEKLKQLKSNHAAAVAQAMNVYLRSEDSGAEHDPGAFDNYRTEVVFAPGQPEDHLERFQQLIIRDYRLRSYGRLATGFHGPASTRQYAWIQAFLPVSDQLLQDLANQARVVVTIVRHKRLPHAYSGLIPP